MPRPAWNLHGHRETVIVHTDSESDSSLGRLCAVSPGFRPRVRLVEGSHDPRVQCLWLATAAMRGKHGRIDGDSRPACLAITRIVGARTRNRTIESTHTTTI